MKIQVHTYLYIAQHCSTAADATQNTHTHTHTHTHTYRSIAQIRKQANVSKNTNKGNYNKYYKNKENHYNYRSSEK